MYQTNKKNRCLCILPRVLGLLLIAAMLNACALHKAMKMKDYEDFAEVSNSMWVSLYLSFKGVTIPNYPNVIFKNTVWEAKNSPIILDQNLFILPGVTLTIEPGVKVLMGENVRITCRGLIKAQGNNDAPILFTWKDEGRYWATIEAMNATGGNRNNYGTIEFNHCILEYGHGVKINSSELKMTGCILRHHISSAIQMEYASGVLSNNQIYGNSTERETESGNGGGVKVFTNRTVVVENNTIHDNVSAGGRDGGGGIYAFCYDSCKITVHGNTVTNNRSDRKGGGIFAYEATVKENIVRNNSSGLAGGGIYALQAVTEDNVVSDNRSEEGGGIFSRDATIQHNLIRNNVAAKGSGIFHSGSGSIERNSFAQNHGTAGDDDAVVVILGNPVMRSNNIVATQGYALRFLSHNLSPDLDARENYWGSDNEKVIEKSIYDWMEDSKIGLVNWKSFITKPIPEAFPFPEDVSASFAPALDTLAPHSVRGAIEQDTVWGDGTPSDYSVVGNLLIQSGKTLTIAPNTTLKIKNGVSIRVRGKLLASGEEKHPVIFTGSPDKPWDQLLFENRSLDREKQEAEADHPSTLKHCVIENGTGVVMDGMGADLSNCRIENNKGSGVRIKEVSVIVKGCTIQNNTSDSDGGGIYAYGSLPILIHDNVIKNNRAKDGGGIFAYGYLSNAAVDMHHNLIQGNTSQGDGGGIWASRSSIVDNKIIGNVTQNNGGGLYAGFALVNDNQIMENTASVGGGIYGESNNMFIGNAILKNKSSTGMGGGVYLNYWGLSRDNKVFNNNLVKENKTKDGLGTGGICLNGDMDFKRNAVFNNSGLQLNNLTPSASEIPIKAEECYWGTTDQNKIKKLIRDGKDDASLSLVEYEPVAQSAAVTAKRDRAAEENQ